MKTCSTCRVDRPDREFYPDRRLPKRSVDGLLHACKDCERAAAKERYYRQRGDMSRERPIGLDPVFTRT